MKVLSKKQIFGSYKEHEFDEILTIKEVLDKLEYPPEIYEYIEVRANGEKIKKEYWKHAKPKENAIISIAVIPARLEDPDNGTLATIATIGLIVASGGAAGALGLTGGYAAGFVAAATLVGSQLINSMFPPPRPETNSSSDRTGSNASPTVTGQSNQIDLYGPVIRNYGRNKIFPRVVAEPFIYYLENDQYLVGIYDFGIGEQKIEEGTLRIGDTSLVNYASVDYNIVNNKNDLKIFTQVINTENFAVNFTNVGDAAIRTSSELAESIEINIRFNQGLIAVVGSTFAEKAVSVDIALQIRERGTSTWFDFNDYNYELSSGFGVENKSEFLVALKADTNTKTGTYLYFLNDFQFIVYEVRTLTISNSIVSYRTINEIDGVKTRVLLVGDKIKIGSSSYTILEDLGQDGPTNEYRKIRLDRVANFSSSYQINGGRARGVNSGYYPDPQNAERVIASTCISDTAIINVNRKTRDAFGITVKINPNQGPKQWDVRIAFQDKDIVGYIGSDIKQISDDFLWQGIKGYSSASPINTEVTHTFLELRIKATDQLNGQLSNLSAECISILDYYDDINNVWKRKETRNPAWIFVDILTGELNQRSISKSQLDIDSIVKWAKYCDENVLIYQDPTTGFNNENPFTCDFVLDFESTVKQILEQVCSVGRATLSVNNGKYGVIIDEYRTSPTQMFNQRNIKSFSSQRNYIKIPDGIRCFYIDPISNWQKNEVIAYNDGFDSSNAKLLEEIDVFGTTTAAQAWRQGRYFLAQKKLRQDVVNIEVDFENLVCSRGDLVLFSHDVMKNGGDPGRILAISGNLITLDISVTSLGGGEVLRVRKRQNDKIEDTNITSFVDTNIVEVDSVENILVGDLFVYGTPASVTKEYLVKSISFTDEYAASLVLVEYNEDIYIADQVEIPDYTAVPVASSLSGNSYPSVVNNLAYQYQILCHDSEKRYIYKTILSWEKPTEGTVDIYEVYLSVDGNQKLIGSSKNTSFSYEVSGLDIGTEHVFKVLAVDGIGNKMPIGGAPFITITPTNDTVRPENVQNLNANVLTDVIVLDWALTNDCDIDRYYIRFSPKTSNASWGQSVSVTSAASTQNSINVPLRTGTYFVKAQDWAGNLSVDATRVVTQVPELQNIDFISEINAPIWDGVFANTKTFGNSLTLRSVNNLDSFVADEGDFFFQEVFDLGDVYTARFESNVLASGFTKNSLMVNWPTLASIGKISGDFNEDDWDVSTYVRARNGVDFMSNWSKLTDVDYMSFGTEATATPWQKFTNADFTGRIFQLRLGLESNDLAISPIVDDVNIIANWTDRIEEGRDDISGSIVLFSNAFVEIPAIQITSQENTAQGDYYLFTTKNEAGFILQFYDKNDNAVNDRKFDWIAKGYGKKYNLEDINF